MNKVILLGRLTREVEVWHGQGNAPLTIGRYTLAVPRKYKQQEQPEADFINCVSFGKSAEFAQKYFQKGQQIAVVGRLHISSYQGQDGIKRQNTEVVIEEQYFAESKKNTSQKEIVTYEQDFYPIEDTDDDLPF